MPARSARRGPGTFPAPRRKSPSCNRSKTSCSEAKDTYWANQVEVQRLGAAGILAHVQGDDKKALELVRAAADLDATMDKHPATPASVLPARELLADLLLELNQPGEAFKEYELSLRTEPNRFRSILGKARAAKQSGDRRGIPRRLSEAGGAEHPGRVRAPRTVGGQSLSDELTPLHR